MPNVVCVIPSSSRYCRNAPPDPKGIETQVLREALLCGVARSQHPARLQGHRNSDLRMSIKQSHKSPPDPKGIETDPGIIVDEASWITSGGMVELCLG